MFLFLHTVFAAAVALLLDPKPGLSSRHAGCQSLLLCSCSHWCYCHLGHSLGNVLFTLTSLMRHSFHIHFRPCIWQALSLSLFNDKVSVFLQGYHPMIKNTCYRHEELGYLGASCGCSSNEWSIWWCVWCYGCSQYRIYPDTRLWLDLYHLGKQCDWIHGSILIFHL